MIIFMYGKFQYFNDGTKTRTLSVLITKCLEENHYFY